MPDDLLHAAVAASEAIHVVRDFKTGTTVDAFEIDDMRSTGHSGGMLSQANHLANDG